MTDILVIEDNPEMSALLCDFLRAEGYSVAHCPDGESAVKTFEMNGAKLVILDVMLPGLGTTSSTVCSLARTTTSRSPTTSTSCSPRSRAFLPAATRATCCTTDS